ncbi:hypothetical protein N7G274_008336 [Stereocaulon virgatum]|uniref:Uncharacterized protein n=1 Tax=Stereocaulon virgatum TaxID=373712 RepID=A0ABR4A130_9LECA
MSLDDVTSDMDELINDRRVLVNARCDIPSEKQRDQELLARAHAAEMRPTDCPRPPQSQRSLLTPVDPKPLQFPTYYEDSQIPPFFRNLRHPIARVCSNS